MHKFIILFSLIILSVGAELDVYKFDPPVGLATISYDEGPSANTLSVAERAYVLNIPLTFHLKPELVTTELLDELIVLGHTVGIVFDELPEDIEEAKVFIKDTLKNLESRTGYIIKLVRLPRSGYTDEHEELCRNEGLIVTKPNLDSEDIEMTTYFTDFLLYTIQNSDSNTESLSICLRDRFTHSTDALMDLILELTTANYIISDITSYLNLPENYFKDILNPENESETQSTESKSSDEENKNFKSETAIKNNIDEEVEQEVVDVIIDIYNEVASKLEELHQNNNSSSTNPTINDGSDDININSDVDKIPNLATDELFTGNNASSSKSKKNSICEFDLIDILPLVLISVN